MDHRVLVIEDDPTIREVLVEVLGDHGYDAVGAANGREALDALDAAAEPPCVILLDLMMPVMDGVEFCRRRLRDPAIRSIPLFLFTARGQSIANVSAVKVLRKPLVVDEFIDAVRSVVAPPESS